MFFLKVLTVGLAQGNAGATEKRSSTFGVPEPSRIDRLSSQCDNLLNFWSYGLGKILQVLYCGLSGGIDHWIGRA